MSRRADKDPVASGRFSAKPTKSRIPARPAPMSRSSAVCSTEPERCRKSRKTPCRPNPATLTFHEGKPTIRVCTAFKQRGGKPVEYREVRSVDDAIRTARAVQKQHGKGNADSDVADED